MNLGFKCAQGKFVCMLSDDCLVIPGAVYSGIVLYESQINQNINIGAIAFFWRNWSKNKKYRVGLTLGNKLFVNHGLFLNKALQDVDYIDEKTYLFYHADGDLSLKMWKKGYEIIASEKSYIEHFPHANIQVRKSNIIRQKEDWENYLKKWENIYFAKSQNNIGGWIYKEFTDHEKTYQMFPNKKSRLGVLIIKALVNRINVIYSFAFFVAQKKLKIFKKEYALFCKEAYKNKPRFILRWSDRKPILNEKNKKGFDRHYIYHTAWAARTLEEINPPKHTDISSSLYFSGIVSAFISVDFYDFNKPNLALDNLSINNTELTKLHFQDNSINSLSCMHVIEHIGLGRYGDSLDYDGDLKAINELKRVLNFNGDLLVVVPIGNEAKIIFNAHRIYTKEQIVKYFFPLKLIEFALIPDNSAQGHIIKEPDDDLLRKQKYACGCFWFKKK